MLEYNEDTHVHKYSGITIPSVTEVLSNVGIGDYSHVNQHILEKAMAWGSAFHKITELDDLGTLDQFEWDRQQEPMLNEWRRFKEEHDVQLIDIEKPLYSKKGFCGKPDRICLVDGRGAIPDIKTGALDIRKMELQINGGYKILAEENYKQSFTGCIFHITPDKKYRFIWCKDESAESTFKSALNIALWKRRK